MDRLYTRIILPALIATLLSGIFVLTPAPARAGGATPIAGIGFLDAAGECLDPEGAGADFALTMTGDLEGCLYVFVETAQCSAGGTYVETGTEVFVGTYREGAGSFETTFRFTAKYDDCPTLTGQQVGRCQHPIIAGSGKGVFTGVRGRLDFKDDVVAGNAVYRGHLRW
jgi:hypothetical protein